MNTIENYNVRPSHEHTPRKFTRVRDDFVHVAQQFFLKFGSRIDDNGAPITVQEFDQWGATINNYLRDHSYLEPGIEKGDVRWSGHLQDRATLRDHINKGGAADQFEPNNQRFQVEVDRSGSQYFVKSVRSKLISQGREMASTMSKYYDVKATQLSRLIRSTDYSTLDAPTQMAVDALHDNLLDFSENIDLQIAQYERKMKHLDSKLREHQKRLEAQGLPMNGGLQAALSILPEDD